MSCEKKKITAFKIKVTARGQNRNFIQMISLKPLNILLPNLVLWCIIMSLNVMQKIGLLFQNINEYLPRRSLLNRLTNDYQTWNCDVSSWARLTSKKISLLSSRSSAQAWLSRGCLWRWSCKLTMMIIRDTDDGGCWGREKDGYTKENLTNTERTKHKTVHRAMAFSWQSEHAYCTMPRDLLVSFE